MVSEVVGSEVAGRRAPPKKYFFLQPSAGEIKSLPEYIPPRSRGRERPYTLAGLAQLIRRMPGSHHFVIRQPVIPLAMRGGARKPNTFLRHHAWYLRLRSEEREGMKPLAQASPFDLLIEQFRRDETGRYVPRSEWSLPPAGYEWAYARSLSPGAPYQYFCAKTWLEEVEGLLLCWWDFHKYPRETPQLLKERLRSEARLLTGNEGLEARLSRGGGGAGRALLRETHGLVTLPSRSSSLSYLGAVYHLPLRRESAGRVWRLLAVEVRSVHGLVLDAGLPGRIEEEDVMSKACSGWGERLFVDAHGNAALQKLAERLFLVEENRVARQYAPVLRFHPDVLAFHNKLNLNLLIKEERGGGREKVRRLNDAEKNLLLGGYLEQFGLFAFIQPRLSIPSYDLRHLGRRPKARS